MSYLMVPGQSMCSNCQTQRLKIELMDNRVRILEAAIEAALTHLDGDAFRSAAIAAAKNQLEKALKRGRY